MCPLEMSIETDARGVKGTNHLCRVNTTVKAGILLQVSSQFSDKIMLSRFPHHSLSVQPPRLPTERQWKVHEWKRGYMHCRWWCNIVPRMSGLLAPLFSSSQGDYTVEGKAGLPGRIIALLCLSRITVGIKVLFQKRRNSQKNIF